MLISGLAAPFLHVLSSVPWTTCLEIFIIFRVVSFFGLFWHVEFKLALFLVSYTSKSTVVTIGNTIRNSAFFHTTWFLLFFIFIIANIHYFLKHHSLIGIITSTVFCLTYKLTYYLTPNGHFSGHTAPLTYRCFIFYLFNRYTYWIF